MCFGPSAAEKKAAEEQRLAAEEQTTEERKETAQKKQKDITAALERRTVSQARGRGRMGRRSLFTGGASGFLGRFG